MANQKTLTDWILRNQNPLDLRIRECTWIRKVFPGWYDIDLSIKVSGETFFGRGSAPDPDIALSKAFCEAVERSVCASLRISSTGVAGHIVQVKAQESARLELYERKFLADAFEKEEIGLSVADYQSLRTRYSSLGIKVDLYEVASLSSVRVFMCLANGENFRIPFGGILGLGSSDNRDHAIQKALIECFRNLEAHIETPTCSMAKHEFEALDQKTGLDRQALLKNVSYFSDLSKKMKTSTNIERLEPICKFEPLKITDDLLASCPLHFFRCYEEQVSFKQPEFVG